MKKKLLFLLLAGQASANVLHFKLDKVKDTHKSFRESATFIQDKYRKSMESLSKIAADLEEDRVKLLEKGNKASEEERKEFESRYISFEHEKALKQEEISRSAKLMEEQSRDEISNAIKDEIKNGVLLESSILLYGGEDATKFLLSKLDGKDATINIPNFKLKIGYIDTDKFMNGSSDVKQGKKFIEKKIKAFQDRQRELFGKKDDDNFDEEAAQRELMELKGEIDSLQRDLLDKIDLNLRKAANFIANSKGYDLILNKELIFAGGDDLTDDFIKNYGKESKASKSKASYIILEKVLENYTKYKNMKKRHESQISSLNKDLMEKNINIQKMKDENRNKNTIKKAEEDFGRERMIRSQTISQTIKSEEESILKDVKAAARRVAETKKLPIVILDSELSIGSYFSGNDITEEVAAKLNG